MSVHRFALIIGSVVLLCVLWSAAAAAGAPRTHDGFFLRLSAGGGYATTSIDYQGASFEVSGPTGDLNIAIGGMVSPNLALHGTVLSWVASDPDVEWKGVGSGQLNGDVSMAGVAGGLTYYFMPANVYLSGSVGWGSLTVDPTNGPGGETDDGPITDLSLGKEWWVGDSWGLGVALALGYHSFPEKGIDASWTGTSLALRFSATMN